MEHKRKCKVSDCPREHIARGFCKLHYRRYMKYGDPLISKASPPPIQNDTERVCTRCEMSKPIEDYGKNGRYRDGRTRICKRCMTSNSLAWYHANKERSLRNQRLARIRRLFGEDGLKIEERRRAGAECDICGNKTEKMSIDHCHKTGRVRGLLCKDCNLILGWVKDEPTRLRAMANYLESFR